MSLHPTATIFLLLSHLISSQDTEVANQVTQLNLFCCQVCSVQLWEQVATQADLVDNCSQYAGCQETILEIHRAHLEAEQAAQMWVCAHKLRSKNQGPHHLASMPQAAGP